MIYFILIFMFVILSISIVGFKKPHLLLKIFPTLFSILGTDPNELSKSAMGTVRCVCGFYAFISSLIIGLLLFGRLTF